MISNDHHSSFQQFTMCKFRWNSYAFSYCGRLVKLHIHLSPFTRFTIDFQCINRIYVYNLAKNRRVNFLRFENEIKDEKLKTYKEIKLNREWWNKIMRSKKKKANDRRRIDGKIKHSQNDWAEELKVSKQMVEENKWKNI